MPLPRIRRTKKTRDELKERLASIYNEDGKELPDLSTLEYKKHSAVSAFLIKTAVFIGIISALSWGGFFFWQKWFFVPTKTLEVSIEGADRIRAGERAEYRIRYHNAGTVPIASADVTLHVPDSFTSFSSDPAITTEPRIVLGTIQPKEAGVVTLSGIPISQIPSTEHLQAFFRYRPGNYNSTFEEIANRTIIVDESALVTTVSGSEKTLPGEKITYQTTVTNQSDESSPEGEVQFAIPPSFTILTTDPAPADATTNTWSLPSLAAQETRIIAITGSYAANTSGEQHIEAAPYFVTDAHTRLKQTTTRYTTDVLQGDLGLEMIVDGSTQHQTAELGETLLVSLHFTNHSANTISGLVVSLEGLPEQTKPPGLPFDLQSVADATGGKIQGTKILWTGSTLLKNGTLAPGATGTIDLSIPIMERIDASATADAFTLRTRASTTKIGSIESLKTVETSPISIALNSNAGFHAAARYFTEQGETVGSGALPPTPDETTKYRVYWTITNNLHTLQNISVNATLPSDVGWTENVDVPFGTLRFNDVTRTVRWELDTMPAELNEAYVSFEIAISPSPSDVGSYFKLLNTTSFEAMDTVSAGRLTRSAPPLTSELPEDTEAAGKGVVVGETP